MSTILIPRHIDFTIRLPSAFVSFVGCWLLIAIAFQKNDFQFCFFCLVVATVFSLWLQQVASYLLQYLYYIFILVFYTTLRNRVNFIRTLIAIRIDCWIWVFLSVSIIVVFSLHFSFVNVLKNVQLCS